MEFVALASLALAISVLRTDEGGRGTEGAVEGHLTRRVRVLWEALRPAPTSDAAEAARHAIFTGNLVGPVSRRRRGSSSDTGQGKL